ncbi:MAG: response regulator transcription factor [Anaerolineae bacterium]|jgi:DNA-binding response OmpR family regulator
MAPHILLVEGRRTGTRSWGPALAEKGYEVTKTHIRRETQKKLREITPDLIILDGRFLRFDPYGFCRDLRADGSDVQLMMILEEKAEKEPDAGVNVYLREPFTARKLLNRVVRFLPSQNDETLEAGHLTLNLQRRTVRRGQSNHRLTPKQAQLLEVFMRHPGEVLSRAFLMKEVWNTDFVGDTRTLDVHIHWLRQAIEENPSKPVYINTVWRVGYRFDIPSTGNPGESEDDS